MVLKKVDQQFWKMVKGVHYLPPASGEGIAEVDGWDGLHQEADQQVGKGNVRQQQVACLCLGKKNDM
jgi:hypothetical protein